MAIDRLSSGFDIARKHRRILDRDCQSVPVSAVILVLIAVFGVDVPW
jgi:hypothetical protein